MNRLLAANFNHVYDDLVGRVRDSAEGPLTLYSQHIYDAITDPSLGAENVGVRDQWHPYMQSDSYVETLHADFPDRAVIPETIGYLMLETA